MYLSTHNCLVAPLRFVFAVNSKLSIDLLESYQAQEAYVPWIVNQLVCVVGGVHHMTLLQGIVS